MLEALRPKTDNHLIHASVLILFVELYYRDKKNCLSVLEIVIYILFFQVMCSLFDFKVSISSTVDMMWLLN